MKYQYKTKPYPHQVRALKFLLKNRGGGLQVPMRWGKTKVAVDFACCLALLDANPRMRVLVVCPLSAVGVWESEIQKHSDNWALSYTGDQFIDMGDEISWRIVNYEQTYGRLYTEGRSWVPVPNQELLNYNADLVIVDESHRIGKPTTQQSKEVYRLGRRAKYRLLMTGTMFHRKPFYVFGQAKFYDPTIFGGAFGSFQKRIAIFGGYGGHKVIRYTNLKWMMRQMRKFVYIERYVPPRDTAHTPLYFTLTGRNREAYLAMEKESVLDLVDESVISPIVLSRHLRCQQIAGGWVKGEQRYRRVGDDKLRVARDRFQLYMDEGIQKVVVGCRFIPELSDAMTAARAAGYKVAVMHGGVPRADRDRKIKWFQEYDGPAVFVSQISTGKEGIDLSVADVMLFYSLSESYVDHDQFSRRIEKYNEQRVLAYDYLVAAGTRDEVTYEAIQMKKDVARFLLKNPRRVEKITAKRV